MIINICNIFSESPYFCRDLKAEVDKKEIINHKDCLSKSQKPFQNDQSKTLEENSAAEHSGDCRVFVLQTDSGQDVFQQVCDQCHECSDSGCHTRRYFNPCEMFQNSSNKKYQTRNITPSSHDTVNEAFIADAFDDLDEDDSELAINESYNLERDDVCTLLAPNKSDLLLEVYSNHDSDRDSGCFSEEQNIIEGIIKHRASSTLNCVKECDIDTAGAGAGARLRDVVTHQHSIRDFPRHRRGLAAEVSKPIHSRYLAARPFHRKIWKRRNGWYKVRREDSPTLPSSFPSQPTNYADSDLRSTLSGPSFEFLRDSAAKECGTGREKENITFEEELSDNESQPDADSLASPSPLYSGDCVADILSKKILEMRLEIARMVAESVEASALEVEAEENSEWSQSDGLVSEEENFSSETEEDISCHNYSAAT